MLRAHCRLHIRTSSGRHFISDIAVSTTPTESQIERQMRLDYEAAEKAYRANMAEQDRLAQLGIAVKTRGTHKRLPVATIFRFARCKSLRDIRDFWHGALKATTTILGVVRDGWQEDRSSTDQLAKTAPASGSQTRRGRDVTPKARSRDIRSASNRKRDAGRWKVSDVASQIVQDFRRAAMRGLMASALACAHLWHAFSLLR